LTRDFPDSFIHTTEKSARALAQRLLGFTEKHQILAFSDFLPPKKGKILPKVLNKSKTIVLLPQVNQSREPTNLVQYS